MIDALRKVVKRMHYPLEVMLVCVRWSASYPLSLRHIEEMMAERGVVVDHATVHRWAMRILPVLAAVFRRRKRSVGTSWRMDETGIINLRLRLARKADGAVTRTPSNRRSRSDFARTQRFVVLHKMPIMRGAQLCEATPPRWPRSVPSADVVPA
jgi:hypothetical protein